jgi:hypothetical protein
VTLSPTFIESKRVTPLGMSTVTMLPEACLRVSVRAWWSIASTVPVCVTRFPGTSLLWASAVPPDSANPIANAMPPVQNLFIAFLRNSDGSSKLRVRGVSELQPRKLR